MNLCVHSLSNLFLHTKERNLRLRSCYSLTVTTFSCPFFPFVGDECPLLMSLEKQLKIERVFPSSSDASMAKWIRRKHQFLSCLVQTRNKLSIYSHTQILFVTWCLTWYFKESKTTATYLLQQTRRKHGRFLKSGLILASTGNENGHLLINKEFLENPQFCAFHEMHQYSLEKWVKEFKLIKIWFDYSFRCETSTNMESNSTVFLPKNQAFTCVPYSEVLKYKDCFTRSCRLLANTHYFISIILRYCCKRKSYTYIPIGDILIYVPQSILEYWFSYGFLPSYSYYQEFL